MAELQRQDFDRLYAETLSAESGSCGEKWREAAERDLAALSGWVRSVSFAPECALFEVYEGIASCDPLPEQFFLDELDRLLDQARLTPNNPTIYTQLEALALLDRHPPESLQHAICAKLRETLGNPVPQLRRFAAHLLGDFLQSEQTETKVELRRLVREDPDWRVRYMAHATLSHLHTDRPQPGAEPPPSLALSDRLRVRILGIHRATAIAA
jgi:hypothetical protein